MFINWNTTTTLFLCNKIFINQYQVVKSSTKFHVLLPWDFPSKSTYFKSVNTQTHGKAKKIKNNNKTTPWHFQRKMGEKCGRRELINNLKKLCKKEQKASSKYGNSRKLCVKKKTFRKQVVLKL